MLNTSLLNTTLLNGLPNPTLFELPDEDIRFNDFGLQNLEIFMDQPIYENAPIRDLQTFKKPTRHGRLISSDFYDVKEIILRGTLKKNSETELDNLIDDMKEALTVQSGNLDIRRGDNIYRRFVSTCTEMGFQRNNNFNIHWCPVTLRFQCLVPFGTDLNYSGNTYDVGILEYTQSEFNTGTIDSEPIFVFIVDSASGVSKINLKNDTTGQEIEATTSIEDNDILIINAETLTVTKNGSQIKFNGNFPTFIVGENTFTVTLTGTSISYALTVAHLNSYL